MKKWPWRVKEESSGVTEPRSISTSTSLPQRPSKTVFHTGIKVLHDGENSVVDIIFIHGLAGDREETWKSKGASAPWPATLLPSKIVDCRMLNFGYDAHVAEWRGMVSKNRIGNHSMNLLAAVATHRENDDTNNRPIIFVCHSMGGLVCEDALAMAQQRPERHLKQILHCTRGIIFLGTPHHGSGLAHWAESLAKVMGLIKQTNSEISAVLRNDSEVLERLQGSFHTMIRSRAQDQLPPIEITCFYEELPLPGIGIVVPSHSAILPGYIPIGIRSNHMDMTKFEDYNDPGFIAVAGELRRWSKELALTRGLSSTSVNKPVQASGLVSPLEPESTAAGLHRRLMMNSLSPSITTRRQGSVKMNSLSGTPNQPLSGNTSQDVPIANTPARLCIPKEFAQHLKMGPEERLLLKAAGAGDLEETDRLVQDGTNLSAVNEEGESALTTAIRKKHSGIAKLLLENGATTAYTRPYVQKPLHIAVQTGNVEMVEMLLDNGADIDEVNARGSVLSQAIKAGREEITCLLLSRDADINLARAPIQSPLGNAVSRRDEPLIKKLLKHGAETDIPLGRLYEMGTRRLSEPCRALLRDWRPQGYEDQVRTIRSPSSDVAKKESALVAALASASEHQQPEIHSIFMALAEEFNLARTKEHVHHPISLVG